MQKFRIEKHIYTDGMLFPVTIYDDYDSLDAANDAFKETQAVLSPDGIYLVALEDVRFDTDDEGNPHIWLNDVLRVDSKII